MFPMRDFSLFSSLTSCIYLFCVKLLPKGEISCRSLCPTKCLRSPSNRATNGTEKHFPLFRSITIASQFARILCHFRLFVQLACFEALRLCRLTYSSHCVRFQPATLWDHVARNVTCATNWVPAVLQFHTQEYTWHVGTEQLCINSQTAGISALRLYILLLSVVRFHVPDIL